MLILVSWNVAGRRTRLQEQADRVLELEPDVVCLQEVTPVTAEPWIERLAQAGLSATLAPLPAARAGSRPLAVLTAARGGADVVPVADVPWDERVVSVVADGIEIVNVHSPVSPKPDLAKVRTHEAVFEHLGSRAGPRVVLGDLNTPRREHADGSVWTFARDQYGRLRPERGARRRNGGASRLRVRVRLRWALCSERARRGKPEREREQSGAARREPVGAGGDGA